MNGTRRSVHPAIRIVLLTLGSLLIILFLTLLIWSILYVCGVSASFWSMLEALATAIATALVVGAAVVAYRELSEIAASRHLEIATQLFTELNSPENIAARRWVFQNLEGRPEEEIPALSDKGREAIKSVLNSLDRAAFLAQGKLIPEEMIMPWMSVMIVKAWARLGAYVVYERARRQEPDYYRWAQDIAERCIAWRKKNVPNAEIIWLQDAL